MGSNTSIGLESAGAAVAEAQAPDPCSVRPPLAAHRGSRPRSRVLDPAPAAQPSGEFAGLPASNLQQELHRARSRDSWHPTRRIARVSEFRRAAVANARPGPGATETWAASVSAGVSRVMRRRRLLTRKLRLTAVANHRAGAGGRARGPAAGMAVVGRSPVAALNGYGWILVWVRPAAAPGPAPGPGRGGPGKPHGIRHTHT